jgi:hypothetical protein
MCPEPLVHKICFNNKCPHNLFWEGLELEIDKVHLSKKALEIGNCCRSIHGRWSSEEIAEVWGLTEKKVKQSEASAWRKLHRSSLNRWSRQALSHR